MKRAIVLLAAAAGASAAFAAAPRPPRCADGSAPTFTGEPFRPVYCPGQAEPPPSGKFPLPSDDVPRPVTPAYSELDGLVGRWGGMTPFGDTRFELLLDVAKARDGYDVHFEQKDYILLRRFAFDARLRPTLFHRKGRYDAVVSLELLPGVSRNGSVRAGAPDPSDPPGYDRKLVLTYPGLAEEHRLLLKTGKDVVRFRYDELAEGRAATATGELRPSTRASL